MAGAAPAPVSVVVSNLNGERYLPRLLDSLDAQRGTGEMQVIVVDRHSTDGSAAILSAHPAVEVVDEPPETGLVAGYAAGARRARHDHVFFCNEDLWLDRDCLAQCSAALDPARRVGAADPWQWTYDGGEWIHGGVRFERARWAINSSFPWRRYRFTEALAAGAEIPFGCAGAVLVDRAMYDDVGGWDPSFFLDAEDVDLFLRGWQRGWRCVTVPGARVFHAVGASNQQRVGRMVVGRRRYAGGRSNVAIVGLKSYSAGWLWVPLLGWSVTFTKNVVRRNWDWARFDLDALVETLRRLPGVLTHRRATREIRRERPGEDFFRAEGFQR